MHVVCILSMYTNTDQIAHLENWSTVPSWQDCNTDPEDVKMEIFLFVLWEIETQSALSPKILWQVSVQCYCPTSVMLRYIIIGGDNIVYIQVKKCFYFFFVFFSFETSPSLPLLKIILIIWFQHLPTRLSGK